MAAIRTVHAPPRATMASLLEAAESLDLQVSISDPAAGHFELRTAPRGSGRPTRITVAVTDNGFGESVVHVAREPLRRGGRRAVARLLRRTEGGAREAG